MTTVKLSDTGEVVKLLTLGMSPPVDNTKPTTNNTRDVAAAAAGPEKETSNMSVLFFTKLLNCVTAPNVPIWLFGMKRLVPNLICNRSDCQGCGTLSQPFFNCTSQANWPMMALPCKQSSQRHATTTTAMLQSIFAKPLTVLRQHELDLAGGLIASVQKGHVTKTCTP